MKNLKKKQIKGRRLELAGQVLDVPASLRQEFSALANDFPGWDRIALFMAAVSCTDQQAHLQSFSKAVATQSHSTVHCRGFLYLWKLFSTLLFADAAQVELLHGSVVACLKVLEAFEHEACFASAQQIFSQELSTFLGRLCSARAGEAGWAWPKLRVVLQLSVAQAVLSRHLQSVLTALTLFLCDSLNPQCLTNGARMKHVEDSLYVLLHVCSKEPYSANMSALVISSIPHAESATCAQTADCFFSTGAASSLVDGLFELHMAWLRHPCCPRECAVLLGMTFAQLLYFIRAPSFCFANFVGKNFDVNEQKAAPLHTPECTAVLQRILREQPVLQTTPLYGRFSVLRGLLSPSTDNSPLFSTAPSSASDSLDSSLPVILSCMLPALLQRLTTATDLHLRLLLFQSLHLLCQRLHDSSLRSGPPQLGDIAEQMNGLSLITNTGAVLLRVFRDILDALWVNWDHPFDPINNKVNEIFETLLDLATTRLSHEESRRFLDDITLRLMDVDWHVKGKYAMLRALVSRDGAESVLKICPTFFSKLFEAFSNSNVAALAGQLLDVFLNSLKSSADAAIGRDFQSWIPALVLALTSPGPLSRVGLDFYALPSILTAFPAEISTVLKACWARGQPLHSQQPCLVSRELSLLAVLMLLKHAKKLDLIDSASATALAIAEDVTVESLLKSAVVHENDEMRLSALEVLCICKRSCEPPSAFEMDLIKMFLQYNRKIASSSFRYKAVDKLQKLFRRIANGSKRKTNAGPKRSNTGSQQFPSPDQLQQESEIAHFVAWVAGHTIRCIYPGAPFQVMAMGLLLYHKALVEPVHSLVASGCSAACVAPLSDVSKQCYGVDIFSAQAVQVLLRSLWDPYDNNRLASFALLSLFPTPLPGWESVEKVQPVLSAAVSLIQSPRVRQCDTGALLLRLLLFKAFVPLQLVFDFHLSVHQNASALPFGSGCVLYEAFRRLILLLETHVTEATADFKLASRKFPMHGLLLTLRYVIEDMDFRSKDVRKELPAWRSQFACLFSLVEKMVKLSLQIVGHAAPEGYCGDEGEDDGQDEDEVNGDEQHDSKHAADGTEPAVSGQYMAVCAWLCIKEASLLLGTIVRFLPLPACDDQDARVLQAADMEWLGELLLNLLLSTRHKGAIEKTHIGFEQLCTSAMASNHAVISTSFPRELMRKLLDSVSTNQIMTRRSAGLPYGVVGLLRAEAARRNALLSPVILPFAVTTLFQLAVPPLQASSSFPFDSVKFSAAVVAAVPPSQPARRDLDIFPAVHSLNIIRAVVRDGILGVSITPFLEDIFKLAICGYTSSSWAIRNSATMLYSVLIERVVGTKRVRDEHSVLNTTTFSQFFSRFPSLHPFLLAQLQHSSDSTQACVDTSDVMTSGVYPVLVLLSKLYPSSLKEPSDNGGLHPEPFLPLVSHTATASSSYMARVMASFALVPLVARNQVIDFLLSVIAELPNSSGELSIPNKVHGLLLQVLRLVQFHSTTPVFIAPIVSALSSKVWLISAGTQYPAFGELVIHVMDILTKVALPDADALVFNKESGCESPLQNLLLNTWYKAAMAAYKALHCQTNARSSSVMRCVFRKRAAKLCLRTFLLHWNLFDVPTDPYQSASATVSRTQFLIVLLRDLDYEVRLATLKYIYKFCQMCPESAHVLSTSDLSAFIWASLFAEPYHLCAKESMRVLRLLRQPLGKDLPHAFEQIRELHDTSSNVTVKLECVRMLSFLVKHAAGVTDTTLLCSFVQKWIPLLRLYFHPSLSFESRNAVAESISISDLCRTIVADSSLAQKDGLKEFLATLWLLVLEILQDDDEDIRKVIVSYTATVSSLYCTRVESSERLLRCQTITSDGRFEVSVMLEVWMEIMCELFGSCFAVWANLLHAASGLEVTAPVSASLRSNQQEQERVFAVEQSNIWQEPLHLSQLACKYLQALSKHSESVCGFASHEWNDALQQKLHSLVSHLRTAATTPTQSLMVSSSPALFQSVVQILTFVSTMSPSVNSKDAGRLAQIMSFHPLVSDVCCQVTE